MVQSLHPSQVISGSGCAFFTPKLHCTELTEAVPLVGIVETVSLLVALLRQRVALVLVGTDGPVLLTQPDRR